jgi:hypothetical protein
VPVVIAIDATCDPDYTFAALGTVVERVRVDFGVEVLLDDLDTLRAADATRAHVVGRIRYPASGDAPGFSGMFVYVKSKMLAKAPADVVAHARQHPAFPNDPTSDQCFDEAAFEAYRGLGFGAARSMLDDASVAMALTYAEAPPIDDGRPLLR